MLELGDFLFVFAELQTVVLLDLGLLALEAQTLLLLVFHLLLSLGGLF